MIYLANGDTLTISNGEADYPETPESPITWTVEDCHDGSLTFGDASSFRKFLEML
jgi:hypothetical protein